MDQYIPPSEAYIVQPENLITSEKFPEDDIVNQIFNDRLDVLRRILIDILSEIKNRHKLNKTLADKIDDEACKLKTRLYETEKWPIGSNRIIDIRRNETEKKLITLEEEKRNRETERWRDIALLNKEFRETFKEYRNVLRRFKIIADTDIKEDYNEG